MVALSPVKLYGTDVAPEMSVHVALSDDDCHCSETPVADVYPVLFSTMEVVGHAELVLGFTVPALCRQGHAAE